MQRSTDQQDQVLVDTGIHLEITGGLALGMVEGMERICMLCPGCQKPTMGVCAWARCSHCRSQLTRLGPLQQEVQYYFASSTTGLCLPQVQMTGGAREGRVSPIPATVEFQSS